MKNKIKTLTLFVFSCLIGCSSGPAPISNAAAQEQLGIPVSNSSAENSGEKEGSEQKNLKPWSANFDRPLMLLDTVAILCSINSEKGFALVYRPCLNYALVCSTRADEEKDKDPLNKIIKCTEKGLLQKPEEKKQ